MSDTRAMVRLMEHAASKMRAAVGLKNHGYDQNIEVTAALAFGEATLRLVAASAAPEMDSVALALRQYAEWAEKTDDAAPLTTTEVESVVRFLLQGGTLS